MSRENLQKEFFSQLITAAESIEDEAFYMDHHIKSSALSYIASALSYIAGTLATIDSDKVIELFSQLITTAENIESSYLSPEVLLVIVSEALIGIAEELSFINSDQAIEVYKQALTNIVSIKDESRNVDINYKKQLLEEIASELVFFKLHLNNDNIMKFFPYLISSAESIEVPFTLVSIAEELASVDIGKALEVLDRAISIAENLYSYEKDSFCNAVTNLLIAEIISDEKLYSQDKTTFSQNITSSLIDLTIKILYRLITFAENNQFSSAYIVEALSKVNFERAIEVVESIEDSLDKSNALQKIASQTNIPIGNINEKLYKIIITLPYNPENNNYVERMLRKFGREGLLTSLMNYSLSTYSEPSSKHQEHLKLFKRVVRAYNRVYLRMPTIEPPLDMIVIPRTDILYPSLAHSYNTEKQALFRLELYNPSGEPTTFRLILEQADYFDNGRYIYPDEITLESEKEMYIDLPVLFNTNFIERNWFSKSRMNVIIKAVEVKEGAEEENILTEVEQGFDIQTSHTMKWGSLKEDYKFASFFYIPEQLRSFIKDKMKDIHFEGEEFIFPPLRKAMKIYSILTTMGFDYQSVGFKDDGTDNVYYPAETFLNRYGNCSSLTAMFISLLEDNLIETAYYVTKSHVFTLINTGVRAELGDINKLNKLMLSPHKEDLITIEGSEFYWLPFETTALGYNMKLDKQYTFMEGWKYGIDNYKTEAEAVIHTRQAWAMGYKTMSYDIIEWREPSWKKDSIDIANKSYQKEIETFKKEKYEESLELLKKELDETDAQTYYNLGTFYALNGDYENATKWINDGLRLSETSTGYNSLGNIYAIRNKPNDAITTYNKGINLEGASMDDKAKILINLALLYERKKNDLDKDGKLLDDTLQRLNEANMFAKFQYEELYNSFQQSISSRASEVDEDLRNSVLW